MNQIQLLSTNSKVQSSSSIMKKSVSLIIKMDLLSTISHKEIVLSLEVISLVVRSLIPMYLPTIYKIIYTLKRQQLSSHLSKRIKNQVFPALIINYRNRLSVTSKLLKIYYKLPKTKPKIV